MTSNQVTSNPASFDQDTARPAVDTPETQQDGQVISLSSNAGQISHSKTLWQKALGRVLRDRLTLGALFVIVVLASLCFARPLAVQLLDIEYNHNDLYNSRLDVMARVADSDSTTLLWDPETGEYERPAIGHVDMVVAVAYSPDGKNFATASVDSRVRLWTAGIGGHVRMLEEHTGTVSAVLFHPDGELLLTAGMDGLAKVWEIKKAVPTDPDIAELVYEQHTAGITSAAFSPDGAMVLTGDEQGTAYLWEMATGQTIHTLRAAAADEDVAIRSVAYSPDGLSVLTGHADGTINQWDVDSGELLATIDAHKNAVNALAFSAEGDTFVSAGADQVAVLWSLDGTQLQTFVGHSDAVNAVLFAPDGQSIFTGSSDGTINQWDIASGEITRVFDELDYPVHALALDAEGRSLVSGTEGRRRMYLLGTDSSGRDVATRLLAGGQVSLKIGFFSAIGSLSIGVVIGVAAGFYRGIFDDFIMWVITTLNSIPSLFLLLIISALMKPNHTSLILVLVFLGWTGGTRIVRGETFSLRERDFVMSARAVGASAPRIMFVHIVPNVLSILLIVLSRAIGGLILTESGLSYLGFGVKPPTPTWGNMLTGGIDLLRTAPHVVFAPGLLISITVLCLYVIGDGLRDAFDPKISD